MMRDGLYFSTLEKAYVCAFYGEYSIDAEKRPSIDEVRDELAKHDVGLWYDTYIVECEVE